MKNSVVGTSMARSPIVPTESQNGSRTAAVLRLWHFMHWGATPPNPPASLRSKGASIQRRCFSRLLDHRRPFYARTLAPRRGRDAGAKRRNPNIANTLHILRKKCVSSRKPTIFSYVSSPFTAVPDRSGDFNGILFFRPCQPGVVFPV